MKDYPKPSSQKCIEKILFQMKNSIYKILDHDGKKEIGLGIFSYIKYNSKDIPVVLINGMESNNEIKGFLIISRDNNRKIIKVGETIYKNKAFNMVICEVEKNKDDNLYYIEIDDRLYHTEVPELCFDKESIYILQLNKIYNIQVAFGVINNINKNELRYSSYVNLGTKYSIIFNLCNNKLISIQEHNPSKYYNKALLIRSIMNGFINKYKYIHSINEIEILIKIEQMDINKKIYFINDDQFKNNDQINHFNLCDLKKSNLDITINGNRSETKNYLVPKKKGIFAIRLKMDICLRNCCYMFAECTNIIKINFINFKTENVKNMSYMFYNCKNLNNLNLFSFETMNVIDMSYMFYNCEKLRDLDISFFDTRNVSDMSYMFYNCKKLKDLIIYPFQNLSNINVSCMFYNCKKIKNLDLSSFDIKKANNLSYMLYKCKNYKNLDLSYLTAKKIHTAFIFFNNMTIIYNIKENDSEIQLFGENFVNTNQDKCYLLIDGKQIKLCSKFNINKKIEKDTLEIKLIEISKIINMSYMFNKCSSLISILDISKWDTKKVHDMDSMFNECNSLKSLDISTWNTKNIYSMSHMFYNCFSLKSLDISAWNTKNIYSMSHLFYNCKNLSNLNLFSFDHTNIDTKCIFFGCNNLKNFRETSLIYHIDNDLNSIDLFGEIFVNNNKNICFLLIDGKQIELCSKYELSEKEKEQEYLEVKLIEIKPIENMSYMFYNCISLKELPDISRWDTKEVSNMSGMFSFCCQLKQLPDISIWNTQKVYNMSFMFFYCISLESLPDISKWDTENVSDISGMFHNCCNLKSLPDISKWNTKNITLMSNYYSEDIPFEVSEINKYDNNLKLNYKIHYELYHLSEDKNYNKYYGLFSGCYLLKSLPDISKWKTDKVINLNGIFQNCISLDSLPEIFKWNTKNVTDMSYMFYNCRSLKSINISKWENTCNPDMDYMFYNCENLSNLNLFLNYSEKSVFNNIFFGCNNLSIFPKISIQYDCTQNTDKIKLLEYEFVYKNNNNCYLLIDGKQKELCSEYELNEEQKKRKILEIKLVQIYPIEDMSYMFCRCISLRSIDFGNWNSSHFSNLNGIFYECNTLKLVTDISKLEIENVINLSNMFYNCSSLEAIPDIYKWDTKNVTNLSNIFYNCSSLKSLPDISKWDTKNVTNLSNMFYNCSSLKSLPDISKWDTKNVTNLNNIFYNCSSLEFLPDISKWNTENVKNGNRYYNDDFSEAEEDEIVNDYKQGIFENCLSLKSLPDISKWSTKNFKDMSAMFRNCKLLISLPDISKWDVENVRDMGRMFEGCISLKSLPNISKWNIKNLLNMKYMFYNCYNLDNVKLPNFHIINENYVKHMFYNCKNLKDIDLTQFSNKINIDSIFRNYLEIHYYLGDKIKSIKLFGEKFVDNNKDNCYLLIDGKQIELCSEYKLNDKEKKQNFLKIKLIEINIIENMSYMFYNCTSLISLPNIRNFDMKNVTNMSYMFYNCTNLEDILFLPLNLKKANMYLYCSSSNDFENLEIYYQFENGTELIKLFGEKFVDNNRDNCYLLIDEKQVKLCSEYKLNDKEKEQKFLEIKLIEINIIENMSYMFYNCTSLTSLPNLKQWHKNELFDDSIILGSHREDIFYYDFYRNNNENNLKYMFYGCDNFIHLNKMEFIYNFSQIIDRIKLFSETFVENNKDNCYLLIDGKHIELCSEYELSNEHNKQKTLEIQLIEFRPSINYNYMFYNCSSLTSLSETLYGKKIFFGCNNLKMLQKITIIYNCDNTMNSIQLFGEEFVENNKDNCYLLINGKNIELCSEYILSEEEKNKKTIEIELIEMNPIQDMSDMFYNCYSLAMLPNIDIFNTESVFNMRGMFYNCNKLKSLPDISKWDTGNVHDLGYMFYNCSSLESLPDISKWYLKNVTFHKDMFVGCSSLKSIPDINEDFFGNNNIILHIE